MNEGMGQLGRTTFDYHWKSMESLVGTKNLVLLVATIAFSFFEIYKGGIKCARSVVLSKMVTHYGPRSGFLYYSMTTSPSRELLLSATRGCAEQLSGF
jgi:hypothetical protein